MQESTFRFHLHGCEIFGFHVQPALVKGVVVLVHGFGEHSGRYRKAVIPMLLNAGLAVVTYDNIGHGRSSGKRGHCPSYTSLLDVLTAIANKGKELFPEKPVFLYGHSMGGNLVLNYVLRSKEDFAGVIATSPYLRLAFRPPKWKMFLGRLLMGMSITLPSGLDPNGISRIPEEVEKYRADPLVHDRVSPMYSFPVMDAGQWAIKNANQLQCDTLLFHGTDDQIIDYRGTEAFHENASTTTLKLFEGGYHELHNDLCENEVLITISDWLKNGLQNRVY